MSKASDLIAFYEKQKEFKLTLKGLIKFARQSGKFKGYDIRKEGKVWKPYFQGVALSASFDNEKDLRNWIFKTIGVTPT